MATGIGVGISSVFETTVGTPVPAFENLYSINFGSGPGEHMSIPNNALYTPTGPWSASLWYKGTILNSVLLSKWLPASPGEFLITAAKTTGNFRVQWSGGGPGTEFQILNADGGGNVSDGDWHHLVCTFNGGVPPGASVPALYVDGVPYTDALGNATYGSIGSWSTPVNNGGPLNVATRDQITGSVCHLDEISMWNVELTPGEVVSIYNGGSPTDLTGSTGLTGWWRNGDPTGTGAYPIIVDHSPTGNDGTMFNMGSGDIVTDVP